MTRFFKAHHGEAAESGPASPMSLVFDLKHLQCGVIPAAAAFAGLVYLLAPPAFAQQDPGVRGGQQNTAGYLQYRGIPIPHPPLISPHPTTGAIANPNEQASFIEGISRAGQLESTCDTCSDVTSGSPVVGLGELDPIFPQFHTNSNGLGARHNADQCFICHAQPTLGGSGGFIVPNPGKGTPMLPENPLFRLVPLRFGKQNVVPTFEQQYGPIREVRFKFKPDGTRDGGVHQLWVVTGITKDPTLTSCSLTQPDFASQLKAGNLSFRIPLQMLGLGLIDSIQDREILSRFNATASQRAALGIAGHPNRSGNDGTITRFGWKAQNKSLTMFAAEAYNVEMGITNELFPTATEEDPGCQGPAKPEPNDVTRTDPNDSDNEAFNNPLHILADWMQFAAGSLSECERTARPNCVQRHWLRPVPYAADADCAGDEQCGSAKPAGEPVLRPPPAPHGPGPRGQHHPGPIRAGRIPHHAAVGRRPAAVLPPRRADQRPAPGHPAAFLGCEQCDHGDRHEHRVPGVPGV